MIVTSKGSSRKVLWQAEISCFPGVIIHELVRYILAKGSRFREEGSNSSGYYRILNAFYDTSRESKFIY